MLNITRYLKKINLCVLACIMSGCGATGNLVDLKGDKELTQYSQQRNALIVSLRQFIGSNKSVLKEKFGEPSDIAYKRKLNDVEYQERWEYKHSGGIPLVNSWSYLSIFFINDGKVANVDVF